jgi:ABC-type polysaccharide/polyol phosphate export permease
MRKVIGNLLNHTRIVFELSKKEVKLKYYGSFLGITWALIHPIIIVSILWFVFQVGFKSAPVGDVPFTLWLAAGIIPWFFISDAMVNGVTSITDNVYLVKKVVFRVELLPIVRIVNGLKFHLFFVLLLLVVYLLYGYRFNFNNLQLIYYLICSFVLTCAFGYLVSSLNVFFKDTVQVVSMMTQFGFWLTPIFWMIEMVPEEYHAIIRLNPVYYIVQGYRNALFTNESILSEPFMTFYFWGFTLILFALGFYCFKKLKPHFADVL